MWLCEDATGLQPISVPSPKSLGCPRITKHDDCMTSVVLPGAILSDLIAERLTVRYTLFRLSLCSCKFVAPCSALSVNRVDRDRLPCYFEFIFVLLFYHKCDRSQYRAIADSAQGN